MVADRLGHAKIPAKFEMPIFTRYGNIKGVAKCRKWGGLGWLGGHPSLSAMSPFDRANTSSYSSLIETIRPSCTVYEIWPSIGPKSLYFDTPLAFNALGGGVPLGRSP